jgi:transposase-like protein
MSALRRKFTAEFKHEAVALAPRSGRSAHQGTQEVGVSQTALRHWLREATRAASGPNGFPAGEARKALRREMERLRMERDLLKGGRLLRQRVARSSAVIQAEKAQDPVEVLGRVMAVARSGFYAGGQRPRSRRAQEPQAVRAQIRPSHQESDGRYGSPRMHRDRRPQGFPRSSRHRVARLLRLHGLRGGCRRRTTGRSPAVSSEVLAANVLPRQVTATPPHQTWAGDSTVVAPREGGAVCGGAVRLVCSPGRGLGAGGTHPDRGDARGTHAGGAPAAGRAAVAPSLGSRQPIYGGTIPPRTHTVRLAVFHEPALHR